MIRRIAAWALPLGVFATLVWSLLALPGTAPSLTDEALAALDKSGVSNPVTAVLLNYRSTDTLLELGVLLLAVASVWSLRRADHVVADPQSGPLLEGLIRGLVPLLLVTGGCLLWIGAFAPGGAFQGGALVGGAIVLLALGGLTRRRFADHQRLLRVGLSAGLAVFSAVGWVVTAWGGWFLEYPDGAAKSLILVIEAAALVSIGLTLGCLFMGGRSPDHPESEDAR